MIYLLSFSRDLYFTIFFLYILSCKIIYDKNQSKIVIKKKKNLLFYLSRYALFDILYMEIYMSMLQNVYFKI